MPTPLRLKPPTAAWIVTERRRLGLKPRDVASRMNELGYPDVSEATVKVWESNGNRRPNPYNLEGLERLFDSKAPDLAAVAGDQGALVAALTAQTTAINDLVSLVRALLGVDTQPLVAATLLELVEATNRRFGGAPESGVAEGTRRSREPGGRGRRAPMPAQPVRAR